MRFLANPCGDAAVAAMQDHRIGLIDTPYQQMKTRTEAAHASGVMWCADNGCFTGRNWSEDRWWRFLVDNAHRADTCLFATAPDVVGDAAATLARSEPWLARIQDLGYPVALVAQDGLEELPVPWDDFDVLFLGGTNGFKLGAVARALVLEAKRRGMWVHMGRVNSQRRYQYADAIGCDSADGTFLKFAPKQNLPLLLGWVRGVDSQDSLFNYEGEPV